MIIFSDGVARHVNEKDRFDIIKLLTTILTKPLVNDVNTDQIDNLENYIDDMFYCIDTIETAPIVGDIN